MLSPRVPALATWRRVLRPSCPGLDPWALGGTCPSCQALASLRPGTSGMQGEGDSEKMEPGV